MGEGFLDLFGLPVEVPAIHAFRLMESIPVHRWIYHRQITVEYSAFIFECIRIICGRWQCFIFEHFLDTVGMKCWRHNLYCFVAVLTCMIDHCITDSLLVQLFVLSFFRRDLGIKDIRCLCEFVWKQLPWDVYIKGAQYARPVYILLICINVWVFSFVISIIGFLFDGMYVTGYTYYCGPCLCYISYRLL